MTDGQVAGPGRGLCQRLTGQGVIASETGSESRSRGVSLVGVGRSKFGLRSASGALVRVALAALATAGCIGGGAADAPELIWGKQGIAPGLLEKPRAMAIDAHDQVYLVDMTARIQVYDADGHYLRGLAHPR